MTLVQNQRIDRDIHFMYGPRFSLVCASLGHPVDIASNLVKSWRSKYFLKI